MRRWEDTPKGFVGLYGYEGSKGSVRTMNRVDSRGRVDEAWRKWMVTYKFKLESFAASQGSGPGEVAPLSTDGMVVFSLAVAFHPLPLSSSSLLPLSQTESSRFLSANRLGSFRFQFH